MVYLWCQYCELLGLSSKEVSLTNLENEWFPFCIYILTFWVYLARQCHWPTLKTNGFPALAIFWLFGSILQGSVIDEPWKRMVSLLYRYFDILGLSCKAVSLTYLEKEWFPFCISFLHTWVYLASQCYWRTYKTKAFLPILIFWTFVPFMNSNVHDQSWKRIVSIN